MYSAGALDQHRRARRCCDCHCAWRIWPRTWPRPRMRSRRHRQALAGRRHARANGPVAHATAMRATRPRVGSEDGATERKVALTSREKDLAVLQKSSNRERANPTPLSRHCTLACLVYNSFFLLFLLTQLLRAALVSLPTAFSLPPWRLAWIMTLRRLQVRALLPSSPSPQLYTLQPCQMDLMSNANGPAGDSSIDQSAVVVNGDVNVENDQNENGEDKNAECMSRALLHSISSTLNHARLADSIPLQFLTSRSSYPTHRTKR